MTETNGLIAAGLATAVLVAVHYGVAVLRQRSSERGEAVVAAIGGGIAAAYVFLHLLPELARGNAEIGELIGDRTSVSSLAEVVLFLVAFAGFVVLYGLDHLAGRSEGSNGAFGLHLSTYAIYNALITYSLSLQFRSGVASAVLFVVAMGIHFLLSDRELAEHYEERFTRIGRPVLAGALVAGFLLAWAFAPTRTTVVSVVLAALSGFVLYNVFNDELPSERRVRFLVFAGSAAAYAGLLTAITAIEGA